MGVMIGFIVGYVMGTRAGQQGFEDLKATVKGISTSEEVRQLISGGFGLVTEALRQGAKPAGQGGPATVRRIA